MAQPIANPPNVSRYVRAVSLTEIQSARCLPVQLHGHSLALYFSGGSVYAADNRCPHMGFPLHRGTVEDGVLTCHWHHARFDLSCGGTFDQWADDVRVYPVEIRGNDVWVDLAPHGDPLAHERLRLRDGLERNIPLVVAKAVMRLLDGGVGAAEPFRIGIDFGTQYRQAGWGQGLTIHTCMMNLLPTLEPEDRPRALYHGLTAVAALVVPTLFLLHPDVQRSFLPSESAAAVQTIERTPPIVLVVFDELPSNSLLNAGGEIDAERYPNFGALAREAYWFRNASTVTYNTSDAVPAILSGRYVKTDKAVPTLRYYPVNLFTALARHYDIFTSMRFQQLCPPRACQQNSAIPADTVRLLLSDLGLVWLHIVLPEKLTEELPPVVGDWAEFGRARETPRSRMRAGRAGVFAQFVSSIDGQPARLYFIHSMVPHMPFEYVPSGRRYRAPDHQTKAYRGKGLFEGVSAAYADTLHQRHLAQVGFVDHLVGDLIARLREIGAYDDALVIITADHGASYREGRSRRQPRPQQHNLSDILQVPLLMKLPGQRRGEVVDRIVETVDILPTILDVLGASASLRLDGRSLIDGRVAERSPRTFFLRNRFNREPRALGDLSADRAASLERKEHRFGRGDRMALYAPPIARHLLGMNVSRSAMHPATDVQITIGNPRQFEAVKRDGDPLPLYVHGVLSTSRSDPLSVAVVVNGIVAAIAHSYRERDGHMFGTLIPETALRDGHNTVAAFVVDELPLKDAYTAR